MSINRMDCDKNSCLEVAHRGKNMVKDVFDDHRIKPRPTILFIRRITRWKNTKEVALLAVKHMSQDVLQ